ncbi:heme biosynthesis HemY N-terminal domain-containing protein [Orbaceae bacterium ESL0727]|nr:heme biosynthesis HemY N-terminal domain-containing protein [Orbaceae bacterium ESL0727]
MIKLLIIFLVLVGGFFVGPLIQGHQGSATFLVANYAITMSFNTFLILQIIFLLVLYMIYWLLRKLFYSKTAFGNWLRSKSPRKAAKRIEQAQLLLLEGNYQQAGKLFSQGAKGAHNKTLAYLLAAQAQIDNNQLISANQLLEQAAKSCGTKELFAFQLVQIRLQIKNNQYAIARTNIDKLLADKPRNPEVLKLADQIYYEIGDYQAVIDILPIMYKTNVYSESQLDQFKSVAYIKRMKQLSIDSNPDALAKWWLAQPKEIRKNAIYQKAMASYFEQMGNTAEAEKMQLQIAKNKP